MVHSGFGGITQYLRVWLQPRKTLHRSRHSRGEAVFKDPCGPNALSRLFWLSGNTAEEQQCKWGNAGGKHWILGKLATPPPQHTHTHYFSCKNVNLYLLYTLCFWQIVRNSCGSSLWICNSPTHWLLPLMTEATNGASAWVLPVTRRDSLLVQAN